jgi:pyruvate carboxylase
MSSPINIEFADLIVEVDPSEILGDVERAMNEEAARLADHMVASNEHTLTLLVTEKWFENIPPHAEFDHTVGLAVVLLDRVKGIFSIETESSVENDNVLIHIQRKRHIPWRNIIPRVRNQIVQYCRITL